MQPCSANVLVCCDAEAAAIEVGRLIACAAERAFDERGMFTLAVPGGSSPRRAFELLADSPARLPWSHTHVFFTDERCVPPDHEQSNYRFAHEVLLSKVPLPSSNVHRFRTELPPEDAAVEYEEQLREVMGDQPRLDFVLLGMGEDTHTASLFPHSPAVGVLDRLAAANQIAGLSAHRLTLTFRAINSAHSVGVLALGSEKAPAVKKALQGHRNVDAHPVQGVRPRSGQLLWVIDHCAASEL